MCASHVFAAVKLTTPMRDQLRDLLEWHRASVARIEAALAVEDCDCDGCSAADWAANGPTVLATMAQRAGAQQ